MKILILIILFLFLIIFRVLFLSILLNNKIIYLFFIIFNLVFFLFSIYLIIFTIKNFIILNFILIKGLLLILFYIVNLIIFIVYIKKKFFLWYLFKIEIYLLITNIISLIRKLFLICLIFCLCFIIFNIIFFSLLIYLENDLINIFFENKIKEIILLLSNMDKNEIINNINLFFINLIHISNPEYMLDTMDYTQYLQFRSNNDFDELKSQIHMMNTTPNKVSQYLVYKQPRIHEINGTAEEYQQLFNAFCRGNNNVQRIQDIRNDFRDNYVDENSLHRLKPETIADYNSYKNTHYGKISLTSIDYKKHLDGRLVTVESSRDINEANLIKYLEEKRNIELPPITSERAKAILRKENK